MKIAIFALASALFICSSCTPVVINGVRVPVKTNTKIDDQTKLYMLSSFVLGFAITGHFYKRHPK